MEANELKFETNTFSKRLKSMLKVDFRRMLKSNLFYIMVGIALVIPILVIVMTSMMEGSPMTDQNGNPVLDELGNPVLMEGFKNAWQSIGSLSNSGMSMGLVGMCNINLMYFAIAVFICLFISEDFRSGYSKNLFTVRAKKTDYVISKTIIGFISGVIFILAYFIGAMLGAAISSLPFTFESGVTTGSIIMCLLSKVFLMLVFASIFVAIAVASKQRAWLSICVSLGGGMLLFMMIPMLTPLDATIMNVFMCLIGGVIFSIGIGAISNIVLRKTSLV